MSTSKRCAQHGVNNFLAHTHMSVGGILIPKYFFSKCISIVYYLDDKEINIASLINKNKKKA